MAVKVAAAPRGYEVRRCPGAKVAVWLEASEWAASALSQGVTLYEWAGLREQREDFAGRGKVFSVPAPVMGPDGRARWAVRHYRRGGAMAMHMEDRYLRVGRPRPWRELTASVTARSRSISTPAVVCGALYPDGIHYRCDLVTEVVPNVRTLADLLHEHDGTRGWLIAMGRAGMLVRQLAEAGIFHVDLNARNILLSDDPDEPAHVIDLDRARVLGGPSDSARERMQVRLTRSIVKIGTPTGEQLADSEIETALNQRPRVS